MSKIYQCPRCGSANLSALFQRVWNVPVVQLKAQCNECGYGAQTIIQI